MIAFLLILSLFSSGSAFSIEDFKGIADVDSSFAALRNAEALTNALLAANSSSTDKTVVIPPNNYYMGQVVVQYLSGVTVEIEGNIRFSTDFASVWGNDSSYMFLFDQCDGITIKGKGVMDGQGLPWWRLSYTGHEIRPKMLKMTQTRNILIYDVTFLNSPTYHVFLDDCADVIIHDITIFVDSHVKRGPDQHDSVMYPLNTDGLDISATNVTIYNCNVTSYDDAIVLKPCRNYGKLCQCAGNFLAYNNTIYLSTGLTIGSVPPNNNVNCVRNVTFRDSKIYRPFKGIYIKSNPGTSGSGIIEDITYENIYIEQALWWTIWIGPQQQNQPGSGDGTGCSFLYPFFDSKCPTQPLVTMKNVRLINVTAVDTLPLFEGPGVIICDETNPCEDFVFERVTNTIYPGNLTDMFDHLPVKVPEIVFPTKYRTDDWEFKYITSNVYGTVTGCTPAPDFL